jgi:alpha-tubulin suppressor-like RCC1 family protein
VATRLTIWPGSVYQCGQNVQSKVDHDHQKNSKIFMVKWLNRVVQGSEVESSSSTLKFELYRC